MFHFISMVSRAYIVNVGEAAQVRAEFSQISLFENLLLAADWRKRYLASRLRPERVAGVVRGSSGQECLG